MNLKILIDLSYISTFDKLRESVAMYAVRVISEWNNIGMVHFCVLVHENMKDIIVEKIPNFSMEIYPVDNSIISKIPYLRGIYRILKWHRVVSRLEFDVIYMPFCWSGNSLKVKGKKVITIRDLRPMRVAERFLSDTWWFKVLGLKKVYLEISKYFFGRHLKNAWKVICISKYVRDDVKQMWPAYSYKLHTIYNGVSISQFSIKPLLISEDWQYILYVNSLAKYKNLLTLIKAYKLHYDTLKTFKIVIVGKATDYWKSEVFPYIKINHLENHVSHLDYVSDQELRWLYEHAKVFVTTSIHEGFGYTPIEAAICGCPVISSRSESLSDVTADKLFYYTPATSEKSLAQCLESVLFFPPKINSLLEISSFFKERYSQTVLSEKILNLLVENA